MKEILKGNLVKPLKMLCVFMDAPSELGVFTLPVNQTDGLPEGFQVPIFQGYYVIPIIILANVEKRVVGIKPVCTKANGKAGKHGLEFFGQSDKSFLLTILFFILPARVFYPFRSQGDAKSIGGDQLCLQYIMKPNGFVVFACLDKTMVTMRVVKGGNACAVYCYHQCALVSPFVKDPFGKKYLDQVDFQILQCALVQHLQYPGYRVQFGQSKTKQAVKFLRNLFSSIRLSRTLREPHLKRNRLMPPNMISSIPYWP